MKKPTRGRPRKKPGEKYLTPILSIGRVPVEVRDELKAAAKASGKTWTAFCIEGLLNHARKTPRARR